MSSEREGSGRCIKDKCRPGLKARTVAVKLLDLDGQQGHKEWLTEVVLLGQLRHPNLVRLIGYCCEDEQRLLVYEYMARGNLENHLFRRYTSSLSWLTRIKIAVGAAKGLAFLYAAPEYVMTGHLTTKNDIYSFGVVLLEILTGKRAMDKKRHAREQNLVEWAKPYLKDHHKMGRLMDPRLEGQYSTKGAKKIATLAHQCLNHRSKSRPNMNYVVKILESVMEYTDIPSGPFVYIAPTVEKIEKTPSEQRENKAKSKGENGSKGYRHKHRLSSRAVYSDTAMFNTSRDEIES